MNKKLFFSDYNNEKNLKTLSNITNGIFDIVYTLEGADMALFHTDEVILSEFLSSQRQAVKIFMPSGMTHEVYNEYSKKKKATYEGHMIASYIHAKRNDIPCIFIGEGAAAVALKLEKIEYAYITKLNDTHYGHFTNDGYIGSHDVFYEVDGKVQSSFVDSKHSLLISDISKTNNNYHFNTDYKIVSYSDKLVKEFRESVSLSIHTNKDSHSSGKEVAGIYIPFHKTMILIDEILDEGHYSVEYLTNMIGLLEDLSKEK